MQNPDALLEEHLEWAKGIARKVWSRLPPSFDLADLEQIALLKTWDCARLYEPSGEHSGVPFKGYAYLWVLNAVRMATRRKHYAAATSEELDFAPVDERPTAEDALLAQEAPDDPDQVEQLRALVGCLAAGEACEASCCQKHGLLNVFSLGLQVGMEMEKSETGGIAVE